MLQKTDEPQATKSASHSQPDGAARGVESTNAEREGRHVLQCMDIWSGNTSIENDLTAPGVEIFVYSRPCRGVRRGGDVYYVSLCAGGAIVRFILADVAGHGEAVADTSQSLRALMRRHINAHSQKRLVRDLNQEFSRLSHSGAFATAVVAAFMSREQRFLLSNAGHPRPLRYQCGTQLWAYLDETETSTKPSANFPLGIEETTRYRHSVLQVADGDMLVFYTDAFIEARSKDDQLLHESGLLKLTVGLPTDDARKFGTGMLEGLQRYSSGVELADDATLIVLRFNNKLKRRPGVREKLVGYARLLHLMRS